VSPLFGPAEVRPCNAVEDCAEAPASPAAGNFSFAAEPRGIQTFKLTRPRQ
jgi:hypothetical protein